MSHGNDVTTVLASNRISARSAFSFEMLYTPYSLDKCLLLCEVSQKSLRGILRLSWNFFEKGINYACTEDLA